MTTGTLWIDSEALAELLGISENGARKKARRADWRTREVPNPGGGRPKLEYRVDDLPAEAQAELAQRRAADVAAATPAALVVRKAEADGRARRMEAGAAELSRLSSDDRATVHARLWVCEACERFVEEAGLGATKGRARFAELYAAGDVEAPADVRRQVEKASARTVGRWQGALAKGGPVALAPSYGKRSARTYDAAITEDNELGALVMGYLLEKGKHVTGYLARKRALRMHREGRLTQTERVPHERTFQRFIEELRENRPQLYLSLVDPARARGQVMPAFGRADADVVRLNQVWELDSTLADVELADVDPVTGEARPKRFALVACVDVFSRRARVLVTRTSRSVAVAAVLRRCLLEWGVPEACHLDNGKDYTSAHVTAVLRQLEIDRQLCRPFAPWEKPFVERFIGTIQRQALTPLPGYTGASVAERKALQARRQRTASGEPPLHLGAVHVTPEELQAHLDDWVATVYAHRPHGGLDGVSPFERAGQSPVPVRRVRDDRALDVLLAKPAGTRQGLFAVGKRGVQYQPPMFKNSGRQFFFWDACLTRGHMGTDVVCREDATDVGKLTAFTQTGEYIGILVCPDLTGMSVEEARQRVAAAKRTYATEQREAVREVRRAVDRAAAGDVVGGHQAERTGADRVAGQIGPSVDHETDGLREAARAARPAAPGPAEPTADERAAAERLAAEAGAQRRREEAEADAAAEAARATAPAAPVHALRPRRLYADDSERYVEISERLGRGEAVAPDERAWFDAYEQRAAGGGPARTG